MNEVITSKEQFWLDHIEAASRSGLSIAQYAKQNDFKAQRLYRWRNIIKSRSTTVSTEEKFTHVVTATPLPSARITLRLTGATFEFDALPVRSGCRRCYRARYHANDETGGLRAAGFSLYAKRGLQKIHCGAIADC